MKKVCFISSSGGHLEQIKQLKKVMQEYNYFFVVNKTKATEKMPMKKYLVKDLARTKNKLFNFLNLISMFLEQVYIFFKEKPDVIITTGAGIAIPMCLIAKTFKRKIIYIESFARINSTNKSGEFLYKYADLFIVQWKGLLKFYPNAVYGGWIY